MENFQPQFHITQKAQTEQILILHSSSQGYVWTSPIINWCHRALKPAVRKGRWPRLIQTFKNLHLLKSMDVDRSDAFMTLDQMSSLQPAGHNQFFGECFQLMWFRAVSFTPWCCPLFLLSCDIKERECGPKCIYLQWNVFHIGHMDLNISGCTNSIWDYVSEENPYQVWISHLSWVVFHGGRLLI